MQRAETIAKERDRLAMRVIEWREKYETLALDAAANRKVFDEQLRDRVAALGEVNAALDNSRARETQLSDELSDIYLVNLALVVVTMLSLLFITAVGIVNEIAIMWRHGINCIFIYDMSCLILYLLVSLFPGWSVTTGGKRT